MECFDNIKPTNTLKLVIEIWSLGNTTAEIEEKYRLYEHLQIPYFIEIDHTSRYYIVNTFNLETNKYNKTNPIKVYHTKDIETLQNSDEDYTNLIHEQNNLFIYLTNPKVTLDVREAFNELDKFFHL